MRRVLPIIALAVLAGCTRGTCRTAPGSRIECGNFGSEAFREGHWSVSDHGFEPELRDGWLSITSGPHWRIVWQMVRLSLDAVATRTIPRYYRLKFTARTNGRTEVRAQLFDFDRSETLLLFYDGSVEEKTHSVRFRVDESNTNSIAIRFSPSTFDDGEGKIWIRDVDIRAEDEASPPPSGDFHDPVAITASESPPSTSTTFLFQLLLGRIAGSAPTWESSVDGGPENVRRAMSVRHTGATKGPGIYSLSRTDDAGAKKLSGNLRKFSSPVVALLGPVDETVALLTDPLLRVAHRQELAPDTPWQFVIPSGIDFEALFNPDAILTREERTADEIFLALQRHYPLIAPTLRVAWPMLSEEFLLATYIVNVVTRLWHYGNFLRVAYVGCVGANEQIPSTMADGSIEYPNAPPIFTRSPRDMRDYLRSAIGCCTDHAFFVRVFLERFGLETRRSNIPGHVTAEAKVDGQWHVVDATTNVIVDRSTDEMRAGVPRTAYVFPAEHYRTDCSSCIKTQLGPNWLAFIPSIGTSFASRGDFGTFNTITAWEQSVLDGRAGRRSADLSIPRWENGLAR